jgi:hypothetical protein
LEDGKLIEDIRNEVKDIIFFRESLSAVQEDEG